MVGVGRDLCGSPSPTPCPSRVTHSRLHRTASRRGLNISREGDSTASLGSLGQGSVTLRGKKFFLIFSWNFLCFILCPLPLVLSSQAVSIQCFSIIESIHYTVNLFLVGILSNWTFFKLVLSSLFKTAVCSTFSSLSAPAT